MIHGRLGSMVATAKLSFELSECNKRQVYNIFVNEPLFIRTLDLYCLDNAVWSSDYPHNALTWPRSQYLINKTFCVLNKNDRRKVIHDTAATLHDIEA